MEAKPPPLESCVKRPILLATTWATNGALTAPLVTVHVASSVLLLDHTLAALVEVFWDSTPSGSGAFADLSRRRPRPSKMRSLMRPKRGWIRLYAADSDLGFAEQHFNHAEVLVVVFA